VSYQIKTPEGTRLVKFAVRTAASMPQKALRKGAPGGAPAGRELSIRAYAEHRQQRGLPGGTKAAVEKALATGRITRTTSGKIDPAAADASWAEHTAPRPGQVQADRPGPARATDISDYQKNRAEREYFLRKTAELEYAEEARQLVRVDDVKAEYFRLCRLVRAALEAVPAQVAPRLVGLTDQAEIQKLLREEIRTALANLSDA
jgi:hypothetical protein